MLKLFLLQRTCVKARFSTYTLFFVWRLNYKYIHTVLQDGTCIFLILTFKMIICFPSGLIPTDISLIMRFLNIIISYLSKCQDRDLNCRDPWCIFQELHLEWTLRGTRTSYCVITKLQDKAIFLSLTSSIINQHESETSHQTYFTN